MITQPDLFGGESRVISGRASRKDLIGYTKATGKQNCSNCGNSYMLEGNTKNYRKCKIIGESASESTDVSRNKVCCKWRRVCSK